MTRWIRFALALTALTAVGTAAVYWTCFDRLPDPVPVHWNIHNQPDRWVPRDQSQVYFFLIPGIMSVVAGLGTALPRLSPQNYARAGVGFASDSVILLVTLLFAFIQGVIVASSFGVSLPLDRLLFGAMFAVFAAMALVLPGLPQNRWMGVRTPWTLKSEKVWHRTHRLTAWVFGVGGGVGLVAVAAGVPMLVSVADVPVPLPLIWLLGMALVPVVYSLVDYRDLRRRGEL